MGKGKCKQSQRHLNGTQHIHAKLQVGKKDNVPDKENKKQPHNVCGEEIYKTAGDSCEFSVTHFTQQLSLGH